MAVKSKYLDETYINTPSYKSKIKTISIIIPTIGRISHISQLLKSILNQSIPPDEIIIVDGSHNKKVISNFKKYELGIALILIPQEEGGLPSARNIGIENAKGDIILFLDDDVILDEQYIEKVLESFSKIEGIRGVTGIVKENRIARARSNFSANPNLYRIKMIKNIVDLVFLKRHPIPGNITPSGFFGGPPKKGYTKAFHGHNMAFKKEAFLNLKFDPELEKIHPFSLNEDVDFSYQAGSKALLIVNPEAKLIHSSALIPINYFIFHKSLIANHYITLKKMRPTILNKIAFLWSFLGLTLEKLFLSIINPNEKNRLALRGLIHGFASIISRELES